MTNEDIESKIEKAEMKLARHVESIIVILKNVQISMLMDLTRLKDDLTKEEN